MSNPNRLKKLLKKRDTLIKSITSIQEMHPGAYKKVYRKCGKPNCWCHEKIKGHPLKRITWTEGGKSFSKAVSDKNMPWIKHATDNYRTYRILKKKLYEVDADIHVNIDKLSRMIIEKTRGRNFI